MDTKGGGGAYYCGSHHVLHVYCWLPSLLASTPCLKLLTSRLGSRQTQPPTPVVSWLRAHLPPQVPGLHPLRVHPAAVQRSSGTANAAEAAGEDDEGTPASITAPHLLLPSPFLDAMQCCCSCCCCRPAAPGLSPFLCPLVLLLASSPYHSLCDDCITSRTHRPLTPANSDFHMWT